MAYRPNIKVNINDQTQLNQGVGLKNALFIGTANWGLEKEIVSVTSFSDFVSKFGKDITGNELTLYKGVELFFNAGGNEIKVYRLDDGNATKSSKVFTGGSSVNVLTFTAFYKGTYGDNISVTIEDVSGNKIVKITDGTNQEIYTNGGTGYSTNDDIASAINSSSLLVSVEVESGQGTINLVNSITATYLVSGNDGLSNLTDSDYTTAMDDVVSENFTYLLIPGKTDDTFQSLINTKLDNRETSENKYSSYLTGISKDETIATAITRSLTGKRSQVFAPNVKYNHIIDGEIILDGSYLACACAGMMTSLDRNVSATHETVIAKDLSINEASKTKYYNKPEQEKLLSNNIVPVSLLSNSLQIIRSVTRNSEKTSAFFEQIIVEEVDLITETLEDFLNKKIGKPINKKIRFNYELNISKILGDLKNNVGVVDAFNNISVVEGSSPDKITVTLDVKPTYSLNFITLNINVTN